MNPPSDTRRIVAIDGDEGLCPEPLPTWTIRMGEYTLSVKAQNYEHAVVWLGVWCDDVGVERRGADFTLSGDAPVHSPAGDDSDVPFREEAA
jgi:hypothetical protein